MPISVQCVCAKKFSAPDKLAGKRVKCPSCGQPLDIPDPAADPLFPELSEGDLVAADDPLAQAPVPAAPGSPLGNPLAGAGDPLAQAPGPAALGSPLGGPLAGAGGPLQPAAGVPQAGAAQGPAKTVKSGLLISTLAATLVGFILIMIGAFMPWITLTAKDRNQESAK